MKSKSRWQNKSELNKRNFCKFIEFLSILLNLIDHGIFHDRKEKSVIGRLRIFKLKSNFESTLQASETLLTVSLKDKKLDNLMENLNFLLLIYEIDDSHVN